MTRIVEHAQRQGMSEHLIVKRLAHGKVDRGLGLHVRKSLTCMPKFNLLGAEDIVELDVMAESVFEVGSTALGDTAPTKFVPGEAGLVHQSHRKACPRGHGRSSTSGWARAQNNHINLRHDCATSHLTRPI